MKNQALGLLAILSLGVGMAGFSAADMFTETTDLNPSGEGIPMKGHVTVVHRDADNNILGYYQYDNVIVNEGLNCATERLFAATNATCAATSTTDVFNTIGLLGSSPSPQIENTRATTTILTGGGLSPSTATTIGVDVAASGTGTTQSSSTTGIQHTFTKSNATAATVGGAVLLNAGSDAIFASKAFTSGNISLNENDTLQITWSIALG